jgi:predicted metalloprotease
MAAVTAGCGSSSGAGSTTTSRLRGQAPDAVTALPANAGGRLAHFPQLPVPASSRLPPAPRAPAAERSYVTALFDDAQRVWRLEFVAARLRYKPARLVMFRSQIKSKCGPHDDSGPFFCPVDRGVYLDLRFFSLLLTDSHVGVAAQGYIVGHELAHSVQRLVGIANLVDAANRADPSGKNRRSVQVELQADCLAGDWAHSAYPRSGLTASELVDAVRTAHVLGDDYLMEASGNVVDRALFTHGSSQERKHWLTVGYRTGRPQACNTFGRG